MNKKYIKEADYIMAAVADTTKVTTTRELKTTDLSVSMRHISTHVDALRNNIVTDSKHGKEKTYVSELYGVIVGVMSMLEDVAFVMRAKGMKLPEDLKEGLIITLSEAKTHVFHAFAKTDFDVANKIRFSLNSTHYKLEDCFSKQVLELQYNVLRQCLVDAFAAQMLFAEAASEEA